MGVVAMIILLAVFSEEVRDIQQSIINLFQS